MKSKLNRNFYSRNPLKVARDLLGKYLVRQSGKGRIVGKIVETEAYLGNDDPACHTYQGKITARNKILFAEPGHAYIYTIYGIYYCFNIVAHKKGKSGGVFLRALEPVAGIKPIPALTNGPSKLCIAFGIDKKLNGTDLCGKTLFVTNRKNVPDSEIARTARINIDYARKAKNLPYRFILKDSKFLSRNYRKHRSRNCLN